MKYSYSDLQTAARCLNKYYYRNQLNIEPRQAAVYLDEGSYAHRLLLGHYTAGYSVAYNDIHTEILRNGEFFEDQRQQHFAMLETAGDIVSRYIKASYGTNWSVLHAEESFEYELGSGDIISYTPDLIIQDSDEDVWIVDHKTTSDSVPRELPYADLQVLMYLKGVKKMYPDCRGFIFNYLRKKIPTQPRLNKTGDRRVNDLNRIDTTYEILHDFLFSEAPDLLEEPEHAARLEELKNNDRFFFRQYVRVSDETLEEATNDAAGIIGVLKTGYRPRSFVSFGPTSCQSCSYKDVCMAELLGHDVERVIKESYKTREKK